MGKSRELAKGGLKPASTVGDVYTVIRFLDPGSSQPQSPVSEGETESPHGRRGLPTTVGNCGDSPRQWLPKKLVTI